MYRRPHIVVLDDDRQVCRILEKALRVRGFPFEDAKHLIESTDQFQPEAAFIDVHLGLEASGLDVIPILRKRWPFCPIIVVTSDTTDKALEDALSCGADDIIRKPINESELVSRLRIRKKDQEEKMGRGCLRMNDVTLDKLNRTVKGPLGNRHLSQTEVNLLVTLMKAQGNVVPRETLKRIGWPGIAVTDNAVDRKLSELRQALRDTSEKLVLRSVYGKGFLLETLDSVIPNAVR